MDCNNSMYDDDAEIKFSVGRRFLNGDCVEQDIDKARKLLSEAAACGHQLAKQLLETIKTDTPSQKTRDEASKEIRIDCSKQTKEELALAKEQAQTLFSLNHTMPYTKAYDTLVNQLFPSIGTNTIINTPLSGVRFHNVKIGNNCVIMSGCLMMSAGGITIEDDTLIGANCQLLTNNHDLENRSIIIGKPIHISKNVWIGAGVTILPGITIGENSVVGAGSVVTKDIPANTMVAGNPAKKIKSI